MEATSKPMKKLVYLLSLCVLAVIAIAFSSCGGGSTDPAVVKPGLWTSKPDFVGAPRGNAVSFVIADKAYVFGGYIVEGTNPKRANDFYRYDPASNSWTQKNNVPVGLVGRSEAVAFSIGGKGYVGTGIDTDLNRLTDFWEYDPATDSWKKIADFVEARSGCIAFSIGDRGFVGTGINNLSSPKSDLWEYLPATNTWVARANFSKKRANGVAFVVDNAAYVLGGTNSSVAGSITDVEKYTPNTDVGVFEAKLSLTRKDLNGNVIVQPFSRSYASAFTIGLFGYLTCGGPSKETWQYNPANDTWIEYVSLPDGGNPRDAAIAFSIGNFGYVSTGRNGSFRFDDTWSFDPAGVTK
jgi:Galactose oxidase, central domain